MSSKGGQNIPAGAPDKPREAARLQNEQDDVLAAVGGWSWEGAELRPADVVPVSGEDPSAKESKEGAVAEAA